MAKFSRMVALCLNCMNSELILPSVLLALVIGACQAVSPAPIVRPTSVVSSARLVSPDPANILVDANQVVRQKPLGIGGVDINSHSPDFAKNANGIDFQDDLKEARVQLVRSLTYPDNRNPNNQLAYFDRNVKAIIGAGATPLLIQYINPKLPFLKVNGTVGGTVETNLVFLVKHYMAAPYNLKLQYWEISNEPDLGIDYKVSSPQEYSELFNRCHDALVKAGLRDQVILAGPAVANAYRWPIPDGYNTQILDYFLEHSNYSVDVVTFHNYAGSKTPDGLLNTPHKLDNMADSAREITDKTNYGMAALLAKMKQIKFARPHVGVGITEHNTTYFQHTIANGLWNLALTHYYLYNPFGEITTAYLFDAYGSQQGGLGHYDDNKQKDYSYWALWINGNLRGSKVLSQKTTGNLDHNGKANLLVTATKDSANVYVEVINRSLAEIRDHVFLKGAGVGGKPKLFTMADGVLPQNGKPTMLGTSFDYVFPPMSASIFKFPLSSSTSRR